MLAALVLPDGIAADARADDKKEMTLKGTVL